MKLIIRLKLGQIQRRLQESHKSELVFDDNLVDEVARRCTEVETGARNVDNILSNTLLPDLSRQLLGRMAENQKIDRISVSVGPDGSFLYS
jgi:type VI secretion system protein VasG